MTEEDGFVGEGRRKGDLKPWTLIGGDEAWVSLWWHSLPDICLALNNTPDRAREWWPPGRLTLQPVPRWVTSGHFLSLSVFPLIFPCLSLSVSGLSIHIHLSDGSLWGAYSWHAGVFISTSNPFRVGLSDHSCYWQATQASATQQPSAHDSMSLQKRSKERPQFRERRLTSYLLYGHVICLYILQFDALVQYMYSNLQDKSTC